MAVMVRCTGCRGASQVPAEALGMLVQCPRCHEPFLALEEAGLAPRKRSRPEPPPEPRPKRRAELASPAATDEANPHDAPLAPAVVPVSVLFGLALLPLAIPLLWLIGPQILAKPPALSFAAPASLAIAASTLCLAVVFTVDWTPATRIKGVLILVGLSYFAGLSLYFLKKEIVDRLEDFFTPSMKWRDYRDPESHFVVTVPDTAHPLPGEQPLPGWSLKCLSSSTTGFPKKPITFTFGAGPDAKPHANAWFQLAGQALEARLADATLETDPKEVKSTQGHLGEQWVFKLPGEVTRVVRLYRFRGKVYYLAAESEGLEPEEKNVTRFFDSFRIDPPVGK